MNTNILCITLSTSSFNLSKLLWCIWENSNFLSPQHFLWVNVPRWLMDQPDYFSHNCVPYPWPHLGFIKSACAFPLCLLSLRQRSGVVEAHLLFGCTVPRSTNRTAELSRLGFSLGKYSCSTDWQGALFEHKLCEMKEYRKLITMQ